MDYLEKKIPIKVLPSEAATLVDYIDNYLSSCPPKELLNLNDLMAALIIKQVQKRILPCKIKTKVSSIEISYVELETINTVLNKNKQGYYYGINFFRQIDQLSCSRFRWAEEAKEQKLLPAAKMLLAEVNEEY